MLADSFNSPGHGLWNLQLVFTIREPLDVHRFESAWRQVVTRHPALRTRFLFPEQCPPLQVVEEDAAVSIEELDWTRRPPDRIGEEVEALRREALLQDLDVAVAPVMRVVLVRARPDLSFCIWVGHHALVDGRSMYNLAHEVATIYHEGHDRSLPPARPFQEYVEWLPPRASDDATRFWREHLEGVTHPTPLGWPRPGTGPGHLGGDHVRLSRPETARLEEFCARHGVTMNSVVQAAWALLLQRYSGEDDVVFGSTRACRRSALDGTPGVENVIGQFVHAVPVRVRFTPGRTALDVVRDVLAQHRAVRPFEHSSPLAIRKATGIPRGARLFETVVTFERASTAATLKSLGGFWDRWDVLDRGRNGYALTVFAYQEPEMLLRMEWHGAWLADAVASRMLRQLARIPGQIADNPDQPALEVETLSREDRDRLVEEWNRTDVPYPKGATLHGLIEAQARRTPSRPAVSFGGDTLSYEELSRRASRRAAALRAQGVGRGSIVAVCLQRSLELVVSLLAVLEAGAAYLPVDPEQPSDRKRFVLEDARAQVLITTRELSRDWPPAETKRILVGSDEGGAEPAALDDAGVAETDPAYVIYTSGSTGQPKGVVNSHRGIVNRLRWMQDTYRLSDQDRVLQKTPIGFDVSVWELFWPLLTGARLVLARPGGHRDPRYLAETIVRYGITVAHFVPSTLTEFLATPEAAGCGTLRLVVCSGEALPVDVQNRFLSTLPARLDNLYGPTEAAVDVTYWPCRPDAGETTVPIGRPVANTRLYVLDPRQRLAPIGMPGELYIGGVQVADGYVNRPELTASRFVPDPFAGDPAARLYRTGDLVRYREDGALEFLGRNDHQVKVRGFRIEPEEIESALRRHEAVRDAAVVVRHTEGEPARLVAFVAFAPAAAPTTTDVRRFLRRWLPDAMVPGLVLEIDELPRLSSGKVDRGALRALADATLAPSGPRQELRTEVERTVAAVWKSLLKVAAVGPQDNFYELGGDSLLAVEAAIALEESFGGRIDPRLMFFQTLEQVAANVEARAGGRRPAV